MPIYFSWFITALLSVSGDLQQSQPTAKWAPFILRASKLTGISALIILGVVSDWYCAYEWFQKEYPFYSAEVLTRMLLIVLACAAIGAMTAIYRGKGTKETDERNARNYLSHWADHVAKNMESLEIQQWLDKQSRGLRSKLRNTMSAVFNHGLKFGLIPRGASGEIDNYNPMKLVSAPCKSDFESVELSGAEAAAVIRCISDPLVKVLVILIAVTGMRISEALALGWDAIDWIKGKIRIRRKWNGKSYGPPKSRMSRKPVEMTKGLATVLEVWRKETMYAKDGDLLFPSYRKEGTQPRLGSMIVEDYIRPAAILAGVLEERVGQVYYDGETVTRFGFHSLRHGLATWLAEQGTDPVVIQRMLRHSSKDMTMHYVHAKAREAQEQYIAELGIAADANSDGGCSLRVQ
jgi:integrase